MKLFHNFFYRLHHWENWRYEADNSCTQIRICSSCNKKEYRINHEWGDWKRLDKACKKIRKCLRDDAVETKELDHEWNYKNSEESVCRVCGKKCIQHAWGVSPEGYSSVCKKCGQTDGYEDYDAQAWCSDDYH